MHTRRGGKFECFVHLLRSNALLFLDVKKSVSDLFIRATAGVDRICSFWRPAGLPEKEPWT